MACCSRWNVALYLLLVVVLWTGMEQLATPSFHVHSAPAAIVITGTSSGFGRSLTLHFAKKGFTVFAGVRKDADVDALRKHAISAGLESLVRPLILDVSKPAQITSAVESVAAWAAHAKAEGKPNHHLFGVVNNAGVNYGFSPGTANMDDVLFNYDINVFGPQRMVEAFLPMLKKAPGGGGRIINIGSLMGRMPLPLQYPYTGTKFALAGYTQALRIDLAFQNETGISASIVEPGLVATEMCKNSLCGEGLEDVSNVVEHALLSRRPKTRYPVAAVVGVPCWFLGHLISFFPDRVTEFVLVLGARLFSR